MFICERKMSRQISYWLVQCVNPFAREKRYLKLNLDGAVTTRTTDNPKQALRFMERAGAEQMAQRLGWPWEAVEVKFNGGDKVC